MEQQTVFDRMFSIQNSTDFEMIALEVFDYQYNHCAIYREYVDRLNWKTPSSLEEIPFLPISFFKTHKITDGNSTPEIIFKSSGTGGNRSNHYLTSTAIYQRSFTQAYNQFIGDPEDQVILALLPNYLEQGDSSLVFMVDDLIQQTNNAISGFILNDFDEVIERYNQALLEQKQVVIIGVSYALLDLCERHPNLDNAFIIETGGMKGKRKELTKQELHHALKTGLNCKHILSEYGMTELLSQAYSTSNGIFQTPPWMQVLIRETTDPFSFCKEGKTGGINIIDLANYHSCSFIATEDLGKSMNDNAFQIMGRFDHSDIRGCNLLVQ